MRKEAVGIVLGVHLVISHGHEDRLTDLPVNGINESDLLKHKTNNKSNV